MRANLGRMAVVVGVLMGGVQGVRGELKPSEPMVWGELVGSEVVVVGRYGGHSEGKLSVKVERVLKGEVKAGEVVEVKLGEWWSVEEGPTALDGTGLHGEKNGTMRICFKSQGAEGRMMPWTVVESTERAIFFFPKKDATLERMGQIRNEGLADGWEKVFLKKEPGLLFRLAQGVNREMASEAVRELKEKRDGRVIGALVEEMTNPNQGDMARFSWPTVPNHVLVAIGDKDGDVYERVRERLLECPKGEKSSWWSVGNCLGVMMQADRMKGMAQMKEWMKTGGDVELRKIGVAGLAWAGDEETVTLLLGMVGDEALGESALATLQDMVGKRTLKRAFLLGPLPIEEKERARFREMVRKALEWREVPRHLTEEGKRSYEELANEEIIDPFRC